MVVSFATSSSAYPRQDDFNTADLNANETNPSTVLELFTSQGCSSCPPANKFAASLLDDPDALVLSYGVTYWDYLGWKDTFGKAKFTQRQRQYGRAMRSRNIYTPQIVLNGQEHSSRYSKADVNKVTFSKTSHNVSLDMNRDNEAMQLTLSPELLNDYEDYAVMIVSYQAGLTDVPVKRGENRGRLVTVPNVVNDIVPVNIEDHDPKGVIPLSFTPNKDMNYAALLHRRDNLEIVNAARLQTLPSGH